MTTTRTPMTPDRRATLAAGLFYLATFAFSIPALAFFHDVLNDPDFVLGAGAVGPVRWGALFDVLTALTGMGTAIALYPVVRRHGRAGAVGFVASRTLEAATIFVGVIALLSVVTLRQDVGSDTAAATTTAQALVAVKDWTFLLGPGVMAVINALCLATVLYRSRLVPRAIPAIGLVGAPILLASSTATMFGAWDQVSTPAVLLALPIAAWELSLGVWMTLKGFHAPADAHADAETAVPVPARAA
jgi:hypothetical protein